MSESTPIDLIKQAVMRHIGNPPGLAAAGKKFEAVIPDEQRRHVDHVLASAKISYRDGLLIQIAHALCAGDPPELTLRPTGGRGTAKDLGTFFASVHIPKVADAYQNIAKNSNKLDRGNVAEFDAFLRWGSEPGRKPEDLRVVFEYLAARVAATSRPVLPMPSLDLSALTFGAVVSVFKTLFDTPSQGAHEQFIIAALLHGLVEQTGVGGYRVETKRLNASDASSKVAGDIQIMSGSRTVEAYEITANEWASKIGQAGKTIRDHDLSRLHIAAKVGPDEQDAMLAEIKKLRDDVSVVEIRGFASALTAALTRKHRAVAIGRLYELLDRYQSDVGRVNGYVRLLDEAGLTSRNERPD